MSDYKKTILFDEHEALGAKMVPFAGFMMPLQYDGILKEHNYVRNSSGIFDVSHMGEFFIYGKNAKKFIQMVTTNDVENIVPGKAQYSAFCNPEGGIIDDLIIYHLGDQYMLVVNAANIEKNYSWLQKNLIEGVSLENKSEKYSLLALQGPKSSESLLKIFPKISTLSYYETLFPDENQVIIARTGYSGEKGYEIYVPNDLAREIWRRILDLSDHIHPVGLGCRDSLRLEMGYCLYGNELDEKTSPIESGLGWITKLSTNFIGSEKLIDRKPKKNLVSLISEEKAIPRSGYEVFDKQKNHIGFVTSGGMSPMLKKGIALASVKKENSVKNEFYIKIRDKYFLFNKTKLPFYKEGTYLDD